MIDQNTAWLLRCFLLTSIILVGTSGCDVAPSSSTPFYERFARDSEHQFVEFSISSQSAKFELEYDELLAAQQQMNVGVRYLNDTLRVDGINWAHRFGDRLDCNCKFEDCTVRFDGWVAKIGDDAYMLFNLPETRFGDCSDVDYVLKLSAFLSPERQLEFFNGVGAGKNQINTEKKGGRLTP